MEETYKNKRTEESNNPAHYNLIIIGIVVGLVGIFLRFAGSWMFIDAISNILFLIGVIISLRAVLRILK
ncbi:MAG: hypothetical protein H7069_13225 [Phormidesmis sp. FL-bin-119]|nr:hypothetical protein [Pedobacter sp.]